MHAGSARRRYAAALMAAGLARSAGDEGEAAHGRGGCSDSHPAVARAGQQLHQ